MRCDYFSLSLSLLSNPDLKLIRFLLLSVNCSTTRSASASVVVQQHYGALNKFCIIIIIIIIIIKRGPKTLLMKYAHLFLTISAVLTILPYTLCSAALGNVFVSQTSKSSYGPHSITVSEPVSWNSLPPSFTIHPLTIPPLTRHFCSIWPTVIILNFLIGK